MDSGDKRSESRHPPVPSVAPWLVIPHEKGMKQQAFYNPCDSSKSRKTIPELNGKLFWQKPSHGGWLVMLCHNKKYVYGDKNNSLPSNSKFGNCFLWNPATLKIIRLPSLLHWITSNYRILDCNLSSPPSNSPDKYTNDSSNIFFVFQSNDKLGGVPLEHVLVYCSPGDKQWRTKQLHDMNFYDPCGFRSLLSVQGKLYALYVNKWHLEIEKQQDQTLTIKKFLIKKDNVFPDLEATTYTHYIETNDEVFGVWMKLSDDSKIVTSLQIRKLDFDLMVWSKVKNLGDNVLFIGNNTVASCSAAKMGLKTGSLFYVLWEDKSLYLHNLENNCTKCILPFSKLPALWFSPEWVMIPTVATNDVRNRTTEDLLQGAVASLKQNNPRSNPAEDTVIFDVIPTLLHPVDYIHFRSICKAAQLKIPATSWRLFSSITKKDTYLSPWLVFLNDNGTIFNFLNPMHNNEKYSMSCSGLATGATIRYSKDGWLLMTKGKRVIFFYNPFTRETVQLPELPDANATFHSFSFSSLPTCRDCIVFAICGRLYELDRQVYTISRGNDNWSIYGFRLRTLLRRYMPCLNCLTFLCGASSILLDEHKWGDFGNSFKQFEDIYYGHGYENYLVSCDENVFLVHLRTQMDKSISVFEFDRFKYAWVRVQSLGKHMLFVCDTSCLSAIAPPSSDMENKIYFPKIHGNGFLYYSLDTRTYRATGECTCDDFSAADGYSNTSWIQPNWCSSTDQELDWMTLF